MSLWRDIGALFTPTEKTKLGTVDTIGNLIILGVLIEYTADM